MKTLILVGGGHAHLYCLEQLKKHAATALRILLVSPSPYQYYSGMFSGFAEGLYSAEDIRIDLKKFSDKLGVLFIEDEAAAVDPLSKQLICASGETYRYDLLSFDIGSRTDMPDSLKPYIFPLKPNHLFPNRLHKLRESDNPVVVGGGAAGVELAFSVLAWRKRHRLPAHVALFSSSSLLEGQGAAASKKIEAIARKKNLHIFPGLTVDSADELTVKASNGKAYPHSGILWLTGPKSPELFERPEFPTDGAGFLLVNDSLQSVRHPEIFGAGDCIAIERYPSLPKNGVYAVRQGPVLWENLKNSLSGRRLVSFIPQKRFLSILSTGGGTAFMSYGKWSFHGKLPWKIKQHIDRSFVKRYKNSYH